MKKIIVSFITLILLACNFNDKRPLLGETKYQQEENARFKDASISPLKEKDLKNFKGLDFFPVDSSFVVRANLTRIHDAKVFEMPTTTDRKPLYKEYGILEFNLKGEKFDLTIYQNQENLTDEEYKDLLFLPFTDETSGIESYGGGRYMDVNLSDINKDNSLILNFNNTYNPYCAYNDKYSCPLTPRKNHLPIRIEAGVKDFKKD